VSARSVLFDLDVMLADSEEIWAESAPVAGLGGGYRPDVGAVPPQRGRSPSGHEQTIDEADLVPGSPDEVLPAVAT
jgi:hypothetical protein